MRKRKLGLLYILFLLILSESIFADKFPIKFRDSLNNEVVIRTIPKRVISGGPNVTEMLFAIGIADKLVGITDYCDFPNEVTKIESIGNMINPSVEKIVELNPDLVIISTHFSKKTIEKLNQLGIQTLAIYDDNNFEGVYKNLLLLGDIFGKEKKAQLIVENMKNKIMEVENRVKNKEKPKVYYVIGYGKYGDYTAGGDTFISQLIGMAGGKNIAKDIKGWKYSLEKIIENDPDIIICSKYFDTKRALENTVGYRDLRAVKNGKLYEIDNNIIDRQGPRLADGLEKLAKIIHQ